LGRKVERDNKFKKNIIGWCVINKLILIGSILVLSSANLHAKSLCLKNENQYFSCQSGEKIISYCGKNNDYLEYRFGTKNNIEMKYRADNKKYKNNRIYYTLSGNAIIHFYINKYAYILSLPLRGGAVLQVKKNNFLVKEYECSKSVDWNDNNSFFTNKNIDEIDNINSIF
jgi:hypothetical protein